MVRFLECSSLLLLVSFAGLSSTFCDGRSDRIRLEDVDTLTFRRGRWTNSRRSSPIKELNCIGGYCDSYTQPDVVQCTNRGIDSYGEVQWKCEANLKNGYEFGTTDVSCEGYNSREDPYVLAGSCGLEYTINKFGNSRNDGYFSNSYYGDSNSYYGGSYYERRNPFSSFLSTIFYAIIFFVVVGSIFSCISASEGTPYVNTGRGRRRYYNRFGWGYDDDPYYRGSSSSDWWSGFGLGSLGGYMMGSGTGRRYGYDDDYYGRRGGYYNSSRSYRGGGGGGGSTSTSHKSTGFGTTKRR